MKVVHVAPYFHPDIGGMETYVYELTKRLSRECEISVFSCGHGITETYGRVKVFRSRALDAKWFPIRLKIPYPVPPSLLHKLAYCDADIIHAHGHAFITSFFAALAARITKKPFVLTIHSVGVAYQDYRMMRGITPIVDSTIAKYIFESADTVIVLNRATCRFAKDFNPRTIVTIPQGIDTERFKPSEKSGDYITFIAARLVPQKGAEFFVRAIPLILKEESNSRFMVIGDGFQRPLLEKLAEKLRVAEHIDFVGSIEHSEVPSYLDEAKIVVFPSEIPTGLTLLEAAAVKKPIITVKNEWAMNALGDAPIYIPPRDPKVISDATISLLRDSDRRMEVAERAYRRVVQQNWESATSEHMRLYEQLIGDGTRLVG